MTQGRRRPLPQRTTTPQAQTRLEDRMGSLVEAETSDDIFSAESGWEDEETTTAKADTDRWLHQGNGKESKSNGITTPRKRRVKSSYTTASPRRHAPLLSVSPKSSQEAQEIPPSLNNLPLKEEVLMHAVRGAKFTSQYVLDVFSTAIHLLRKPISFILFLWLLSMIITYISRTLRTAFAPLCYVPGISRAAMCQWDNASDDSRRIQWADFSRLADVQSKTFEQLLDESVGGSGLSLEIKKAEMATSDLVAVVRVSSLKSRQLLATSLTEFVDDAKKTGRGLTKLSSKINGAVDSIVAVNDYALHSIEAAQANTKGLFSVLIPWSAHQKSTQDVITETFGETMDVLSGQMERLIMEAEANLANLNTLEERLSTLQEMVLREDSSLSSAKEELLSELWTRLGGNKKTLRSFDQHLSLLHHLSSYRKQALVHVVAALQALQSMSEDMEDMRERVAAPNLVGSKVPADVHMKSIKSGLERLREGRIRAKSIEEDAVRRILGILPGREEIESS